MKERVIISGAHPDDLIGSAGLAILMKDIFELHIFDFTRGEAGLFGEVSGEETARIRTAEELDACGSIGATPHFLGEIDADAYANREVCSKIADLFRELQPRAVFAHWPLDVHLDHVMCAAATIKGIKLAGIKPEIYFFEQLTQSRFFNPEFYVDITSVFEQKNELIRKYSCQNRGDWLVRNETNTAVFRGGQVGVKYAEAFAAVGPELQGARCIFRELPVTVEAQHIF